MSQRAVEQTLGKLLTDEAFRRESFEDPQRASSRVGLDMSPEELGALQHISQRALAGFGRQLDDKICRLCIPPGPGVEDRPVRDRA